MDDAAGSGEQSPPLGSVIIHTSINCANCAIVWLGTISNRTNPPAPPQWYQYVSMHVQKSRAVVVYAHSMRYLTVVVDRTLVYLARE